MADDILATLKADLNQRLQQLLDCKRNVQELRLAIEAIEKSRQTQAENKRASDAPPKVVRRGELKRALLDCIRSGVGARSAFENALMERGIETSPNSISNALHRMMTKNEIRWDNQQKMYVLQNAEDPAGETARSSQLSAAEFAAAVG